MESIDFEHFSKRAAKLFRIIAHQQKCKPTNLLYHEKARFTIFELAIICGGGEYSLGTGQGSTRRISCGWRSDDEDFVRSFK